MKSTLYQYKETAESFELYVHECSTIDGLKAINNQAIKLIVFGATSYKNLGYATEKNIPESKDINSLVDFLEKHEDIGLIEFEIEIIGKGKLCTHDDGECLFIFNSKQDIINVLKQIAPKTQTDFVVAKVLDNTDFYVSIDSENKVKKFATFEQYINQMKL